MKNVALSASPIVVRELGDEHARSFLALAARCDTGTAAFRVDRSPDPFALGRFFGPTTTYGVFLGERLVATGAISTQRRYVSGLAEELLYLHDVRVDPEHRRMGIARALGEAVLPRLLRDPRPVFTTVLEDNPLSEIIVAALSARLGPATRLGQTAHTIASPLSLQGTSRARTISRDEFETHFRARPKSGLACADDKHWREDDGRFLMFTRDDEVEVAKLVDESHRRRFVTPNGPVAIGTLSFLSNQVSNRALFAFLAAADEEGIVAFGCPAVRSRPLTKVAVRSSTFAFRWSSVDSLLTHELILI